MPAGEAWPLEILITALAIQRWWNPWVPTA